MSGLIYQEIFKFLNKKEITLIGLGRSNLEVAKILDKFGIDFNVCDVRLKISDLNLKKSKVKFNLGANYLKRLKGDLIFRSPVVSCHCEELNKAKKRGALVTSESELFFRFCPCNICGVTGSDGKTTVTTLIYEILKNASQDVFIGGNIGFPLLPLFENLKRTSIVVAELSSFQLISMRKSPKFSVITNISPNHLDIHKDFSEYIFSKFNALFYQNENDFAILNYEDEILRSISKKIKSNVRFFSSKRKVKGVWLDENGFIILSLNNEDIYLIHRSELKIPGKHNLENFMAAVCTCSCMMDIKNIIHAIKITAENFSGVEHRIEFVCENDGVKFYNDSIASSPTRTIKGALSVFDAKNVILIAGGYNKKLSFEEFGNEICQKVKVLILIGNSAPEIRKAVMSSEFIEKPLIFNANSMKEAVFLSNKNAKKGDVVLLSPACASFDMYKNFEERGNDFKNEAKACARKLLNINL
ncbi:MAG: UDP-N-acetylmuramoyl-L-alanine--D-glutamate ligase [Oscillospiraceae bacterium]|nr:UDP-N-acetylmuramoyl-L-alanine--D-glutamate ligase [Oscillospiraceae bacterium]